MSTGDEVDWVNKYAISWVNNIYQIDFDLYACYIQQPDPHQMKIGFDLSEGLGTWSIALEEWTLLPVSCGTISGYSAVDTSINTQFSSGQAELVPTATGGYEYRFHDSAGNPWTPGVYIFTLQIEVASEGWVV